MLHGDAPYSPVQELEDSFLITATATAQDSYWLPSHFLEMALYLQCQLQSRVILEVVGTGSASGNVRKWPHDYFSFSFPLCLLAFAFSQHCTAHSPSLGSPRSLG